MAEWRTEEWGEGNVVLTTYQITIYNVRQTSMEVTILLFSLDLEYDYLLLSVRVFHLLF